MEDLENQIQEEKKFEFVDVGKGRPIVLLHGLFGALSNFKGVLEHFTKKNYRVIIPLLPIYSYALINTNVQNLAKYLKQFINFKNIEEVNLLGNSLGGHVGLIYASKNPDKVKTLTLTGSSGLYENTMGDSFPRREDYNYIKEKVSLTFYDPKHATEELVNQCYEIVNNKNNLVRILALAKSAIRHNMTKELPNIDIPSCLIWGKNDTITPPHVAEDFQNLLPRADLFWIDKCGHAPMMEHPENFNQIYEKWLSEH